MICSFIFLPSSKTSKLIRPLLSSRFYYPHGYACMFEFWFLVQCWSVRFWFTQLFMVKQETCGLGNCVRHLEFRSFGSSWIKNLNIRRELDEQVTEIQRHILTYKNVRVFVEIYCQSLDIVRTLKMREDELNPSWTFSLETSKYVIDVCMWPQPGNSESSVSTKQKVWSCNFSGNFTSV